ncbi:MAG: GxxExxY protein [Fodinibius sp.]|nr:GxxExxY protein [Fodinibius sp.]
MLHKELTGQIIKSFYKVYNGLGYGFLEKVYENALQAELQKAGFKCVTQYPIEVYYNQQLVGEYFADLVVERKVILELKSADTLNRAHELQLINYLKATNIKIGLLLNFGKKPQFRRKIFTIMISEYQQNLCHPRSILIRYYNL